MEVRDVPRGEAASADSGRITINTLPNGSSGSLATFEVGTRWLTRFLRMLSTQRMLRLLTLSTGRKTMTCGSSMLSGQPDGRSI